MNTRTNAYLTKFSSGTTLALLGISGLLFLVPFAAPSVAANASNPVLSISPTALFGATAGQVVTVGVANPSSNTYAVTTEVILLPSGWTATACTTGSFGACSALVPGQVTFSGANIIPGGSAAVSPTMTLTAPTPASYPMTSGSFTTEWQDGSSGSAYNPGTSFTFTLIDPATVVTVSDFAGPYTCPGVTACFTAGSAAVTLTATVTAAEAQSGLTINWALSAASAGYATDAFTLTASSSTSAATSTTATATATFAPSNINPDNTKVKATVGNLAAASGTTAHALYTQPGAPSAVTVNPCTTAGTPGCAGGSTTKTTYDTLAGTPPYGTGNWAKIASGAITGSVTDAFGNAVTSLITAQTCTITAFGGSFNNGGVAAATNTPAGGSCSGAGAIASTQDYYQGGAYGTGAYVQVQMSGTYNAGPSFTATSNSPTILTSTFSTAVGAAPAVTQGGVAAPNPVPAGSASGTAATLTLSYSLAIAQAGVPVTFFAQNTTSPYLGSFVGGNGPSYHTSTVTDWANITVTSTIGTSGTATAVATFTIDTNCKSGDCVANPDSVKFQSLYAAPITGAAGTTIGPTGFTATYSTAAGSASKLTVKTYFDSAATVTAKASVAGQTIYLDVILTDFWSNQKTNSGGQIGITLTASPSGVGVFSNANPTIPNGFFDTKGGFGTITFVVSSSAALGTATINAANGLYCSTACSSNLKVVSPNPTISVNTPSGTIGHTVYSAFAGVGFSGTATVSSGVFPFPSISAISYTVDGGTTQSGGTTSPWAFVATLSNGLHTVAVWATDSNSLNSAKNTTTVLVDTAKPTITVTSASTLGAGQNVTFSIVDTEGDLNAASVKATTNSSATLTWTVKGANNPGSSVTYTVNVAGLPVSTGHWSVTLNAKDLAGNAATAATATVKVVVAFAQSVTIAGAAKSVLGGYTGVSATLTNSWTTSQNLVMFAVWTNSAGQPVCVGFGSLSLASGASGSAFAGCLNAPASGQTYTVNVFVLTTGNQPVSSKTTLTVSL